MAIGNLDEAIKSLRVILTARKHRTWTKGHEPVILMYLELCVTIKDSQLIKDGLVAYRNIAQSVGDQFILLMSNKLYFRVTTRNVHAFRPHRALSKQQSILC